MNFEIVVVSNKKRKSLIEPYLANIPHKVSLTPDYNLPENFQCSSEYSGLVINHIGAYRCFRGHQDALKLCSDNANTLVFEDDAVPKNMDWLNTCEKVSELIAFYECVSLHGRQFDLTCFDKQKIEDIEYYSPKTKKEWIVAALAYIITPEAKNKLLSYVYNGCPLDLLVYWQFQYCVIEPSPFNHNRREGSLID